MRPLISVIVPIYNVEKYLNQCLLSIQQQTYPHLQVILIDDGSTDQSARIAQQFVDADSRFQLLRQANAGQSAARNRGMALATGQYISFIDADDYITPNFYGILLHEIHNTDILQIGYTRTDIKGEKIGTFYPRFFYQYTTPWSRLFRAEFINKNNLHFEEGHIYEDVLFSIDIWLQSPRYRLIKYAGYYYRMNPNSTTAHKHDIHPLFAQIRQRAKNATLYQKLLIAYTALRLHIYFLRE